MIYIKKKVSYQNQKGYDNAEKYLEQSTTTKMADLPYDLGRPLAKSIKISAQIWIDIG